MLAQIKTGHTMKSPVLKANGTPFCILICMNIYKLSQSINLNFEAKYFPDYIMSTLNISTDVLRMR